MKISPAGGELFNEEGRAGIRKLYINPLNSELNPICHLLALLGAHHNLHVSRIRVNYQLDALIIIYS